MFDPLFSFAVDVMTVFGSLVLALGILARLPRNPHAWLVGAILLGNACAVLLGRYQYGFWIPEPYRIDVSSWEPLLNIGRNLTPALFMVLCHSLFQERRVPRVLLALVGLQVLLEEPIHLLVGNDTPAQRLLTEAMPGLLQAVFISLAVYWTLLGWKVDLVASRRRMRVIVLAVIGGLLLSSVLLQRVIIPFNSVANFYASEILGLMDAAVIGALLLSLLSVANLEKYLNPGREPTRPRSAPAPGRDDEAADQTAAEAARLEHLMTVERVYTRPGLSVAHLADRMGLPEYRLRRLIHEELGCRNFNVFLHRYRVAEACRALKDPEQRRTPILTIALGVGYQSINTFNRGFREVMGITPSAYRSGEVEDTDPGSAPIPPKSLPES